MESGNDGDGNTGRYQYRQSSLVAKCAGLTLLAGVYLAGLLACIIAGATAPDLFTSTTTVPPTQQGGVSSASTDFAFATPGFEVRRTKSRLPLVQLGPAVWLATSLFRPSALKHLSTSSLRRNGLGRNSGVWSVFLFFVPRCRGRSKCTPIRGKKYLKLVPEV